MRLATWLLPLAAIVACSSSVTGGDEATTTSGAGASGAVDQDCFDQCVAKGESESECNAWCGGTTKDTVTTGGKTTTGTTVSTGATGAGAGAPDIALEKSCAECWEDAAATSCTAEYDACSKSLACGQLQTCPYACKNAADCIEECNEIIPTGVEPFSDLVNCMACPGGPCASECEGAMILAYCE